MDEKHGDTIIIIKKKGRHDGHHGGAWKVAYADFVTAMMALFIVLWLLSSDEKVKQAVGGYFQDPSGNGKLLGSTQAGIGESLPIRERDMNKIKEKIEAALHQMDSFEKLKKFVTVTVTAEGLRIELMEDEAGLFFHSGNAEPSGPGQELLVKLAQELGKLQNRIYLEGHTDSKPFSSDKGYSNWELSADRANSARRLMQQNGIRLNQVAQVRGFADQYLRRPDNPAHPGNRRVSIIVGYPEVRQRGASAEKDRQTGKEHAPSHATGNETKKDHTGAGNEHGGKVATAPRPAPAHH